MSCTTVDGLRHRRTRRPDPLHLFLARQRRLGLAQRRHADAERGPRLDVLHAAWLLVDERVEEQPRLLVLLELDQRQPLPPPHRPPLVGRRRPRRRRELERSLQRDERGGVLQLRRLRLRERDEGRKVPPSAELDGSLEAALRVRVAVLGREVVAKLAVALRVARVRLDRELKRLRGGRCAPSRGERRGEASRPREPQRRAAECEVGGPAARLDEELRLGAGGGADGLWGARGEVYRWRRASSRTCLRLVSTCLGTCLERVSNVSRISPADGRRGAGGGRQAGRGRGGGARLLRVWE